MGKFRSLNDIVSVDGYPGYEFLLPYLQRSLETICESKGGVSDQLCFMPRTKSLIHLIKNELD